MLERRLLLMAATVLLITLLSACGGGTTEEKIYNHLEEAVALEADFDKRQNQLIDLEKEEQGIYSEIIELGADDLDEIKKASKRAIGIIEKRKEEMDAEKESISGSRDEFEKVDKLIDKLDDKKSQEKGREMYEMMISRYDTYEQLYDAYIKSLNLEKELYTMLQKEETEQEDVTAHIKKVNKSYEKVLTENDNFNEETTAYNDLKKAFYAAADINVEFDGDVDESNDETEKKNDQDNE